jgi:hypothetical protein
MASTSPSTSTSTSSLQNQSTPPPNLPSLTAPAGTIFDAVDTMIGTFDAHSQQAEPDEDISASEFSPGSTEAELSPPSTPHADGAPLHLRDTAAGVSPPRRGAEDPSQGFWLKVWLWLQFSIVVFVFLYAVAKRGPTLVLKDENKKGVARRRR